MTGVARGFEVVPGKPHLHLSTGMWHCLSWAFAGHGMTPRAAWRAHDLDRAESIKRWGSLTADRHLSFWDARSN